MLVVAGSSFLGKSSIQSCHGIHLTVAYFFSGCCCAGVTCYQNNHESPVMSSLSSPFLSCLWCSKVEVYKLLVRGPAAIFFTWNYIKLHLVSCVREQDMLTNTLVKKKIICSMLTCKQWTFWRSLISRIEFLFLRLRSSWSDSWSALTAVRIRQ